MKRFALALVFGLVLALAPPALGRPSWGQGQACAVAQNVTFRPAVVLHAATQWQAPAPLQWHWRQNGEDYLLYRNGKMVGGYSTTGDVYSPWDAAGEAWQAASSPPVPIPPMIRRPRSGKPSPPATTVDPPQVDPAGKIASDDAQKTAEEKPSFVVQQAEPDLPTGVDWEKISRAPKYSRKGVEIKADPAFMAELGNLPDDRQKDRLTFISSNKEKREAALRSFRSSPEYEKLRTAANAWETAPDDWSLDPGFVRTDNSILLQSASGKVLARAPVEDIAQPVHVLAALRKANPKYDPTKDPGGQPTPAGPSLPFGQQGVWVALVAAALVAFEVFKRRQ